MSSSVSWRASIITLAASASLLVAVMACESNSAADDAACIELAKRCTRDDECCTNLKCMWQGDGAYCQSKVAQDPPCGKGSEGCTQDRHCCSNSCLTGACTKSDAEKSSSSSGSSGAACVPDGAECNGPQACCSRNCQLEAGGKSVCVPAAPPPPGGGCGKLGDNCTLPAQCCSSNCLVGRCQN